MHCLHNLPRFSALPQQSSDSHRKKIFCSYDSLRFTNVADRHRSMAIKASSGSNDTNVKEKLSETYSQDMAAATGANLTYDHSKGMNYDHIRADLIVGSCLQTPADVDKLRAIGVKTVFCLQQDPDLAYFGVDIGAIQKYAETFNDIEHVRAEIRDFDAHDLRMRLPAVVGKLYKAVERNGGVTYIHCTAGMGRAPAVALAYLFWVIGDELSEAHSMILRKRNCCPKVDAIKAATVDILTGQQKKHVSFIWKDTKCYKVEVAGLDVGWGERIPLKFDDSQGIWVAERELLEGRYEYKYVIDDNDWKCDGERPTVEKDYNINNYIDVLADDSNERAATVKRLFDDNGDLTPEERLIIKKHLESCADD